jgi:hypothetical protein
LFTISLDTPKPDVAVTTEAGAASGRKTPLTIRMFPPCAIALASAVSATASIQLTDLEPDFSACAGD